MRRDNRNNQYSKYAARSSRRSKRGGCLFVLIGLTILLFSLWQGWKAWSPNDEYSKLKPSITQPITWSGEYSQYGARGKGEQLLLPLAAVQERIMPQAIYEEKSELVILTNDHHVATLSINDETGTWNGKPYNWGVAAERVKDEVYVPYTVLKQLGVVDVREYSDNDVVHVILPGQKLQLANIVDGNHSNDSNVSVTLREGADDNAPVIAELKNSAQVYVWGSEGNWSRIQDDYGRIGYVKQDELVMGEQSTIPNIPAVKLPEFVEKQTPVALAWEAVYSRNPDPAKLPQMPGVNVISPTWFSIVDGSGKIDSKADKRLVEWAHSQQKYVWGLFSNSFDPERTTEALATYKNRSYMTEQLLAFVKEYDLDGINIDFENVNVKDRDQLTQFVRELTPLLRKEGIVVSIDVTAKSGSGNWSKFLDRAELGRSVDYMIVMAYDEHWAASPKAGSVASLPWSREAVTRIMEEDGVPAKKMVLGMPLYTRIWTETHENGEVKVSSKALGMKSTEEWMKEHKAKPTYSESTGQNYAEVSEGNVKYRVWLEDETSIKARLKMAKELDLAGFGVWARSFGNEKAWELLKY
ncbi:glycosyl hydrolase family 18 protein [Paenibacillus sp. SC116]|uniref:glycosyl hydrolase family 18 protein n=1 Tax=Paenibacillus sp. SC116 TaxID=2968986 RepID=UPI00215A61F3|nr:glycosyl hydrolase family 18 protein [Paenibacillus sp. SC116]MCR8846272.1 glycosyl hydrolase family 18 protein [Paenibacillus sp. SC116]